ncbi:11184_t:CDS:2, partial [Dentiscutata heterogama]
MIETVDSRDELIKYSFNIIWKATEGKITKATFNTNPLFSVTFFLNDETSETLHLDAPNVVLIKRENFLKLLKSTEQNEVPIIIDDEKDQGSEFQDLDPVTYSSTIQENVIQAEDINLNRQPSDLSIELDFVNMDIDDQGEKILRIDDNLIECDNSVSPPFEENEVIQKNKLQNLSSNNQQRIALTGSLKIGPLNLINEVFKVAKNNYDKDVNHGGIERIPSILTEDSPLPSEKEAVSVFQ